MLDFMRRSLAGCPRRRQQKICPIAGKKKYETPIQGWNAPEFGANAGLAHDNSRERFDKIWVASRRAGMLFLHAMFHEVKKMLTFIVTIK
jgi:hypothetical protein